MEKKQIQEKEDFSQEAPYSFRDLKTVDEFLNPKNIKDYTKRTVVIAKLKKIWSDDRRLLKNCHIIQKKKDFF